MSGVPREVTNGGSQRAHYVFSELARRTHATQIERGGGRTLGAALLRQPSLFGSNLASAQLLRTRAWGAIRRAFRPGVLDLFDHPGLVLESIGVPLARGERERLDAVIRSMVTGFEHVVVVSDGLAAMADVPIERRIVIPNGSDTSLIRPEPFPDAPVLGMVSGATPARGIEALIDAATELRTSFPDLRVELAVGKPSAPQYESYARDLRDRAARLPWLTMRTVPYHELSAFLASASVLAVLLPPGAYWDISLPVKLFDSMAAGRPVVATPRTEIASVVRASGGGVVAASDTTHDVTAAFADVLSDPARGRAMGARGRRAAETEFDWHVLSSRIADTVLGAA
ncbi:MAG: glycosyltransferase family 4 protein [Chloroflexota bacterium]|nr:glycosyltransferase family 4 protein [Chloroflexota bacterium]